MTAAPYDLSGRLVLVTGATRGIGRAVAIAAASAGAELIITGRTIGALEEVDDAIQAVGGSATIVQLDMTDFPAIPRLAAAIASRWQRLDGFVANAGMLPALTPVGHVTEENWNESMAVNLTGQWHMIRAFDPLLRAAPAGRAILVMFFLGLSSLLFGRFLFIFTYSSSCRCPFLESSYIWFKSSKTQFFHWFFLALFF